MVWWQDIQRGDVVYLVDGTTATVEDIEIVQEESARIPLYKIIPHEWQSIPALVTRYSLYAISVSLTGSCQVTVDTKIYCNGKWRSARMDCLSPNERISWLTT